MVQTNVFQVRNLLLQFCQTSDDFTRVCRYRHCQYNDVYIARNNLQLEFIRYRKNVEFIHVYFCEAADSMQYRPPNA